MKKERVDVLLVEQGLFDSADKAKRAIMAGKVYTEKEERIDTAGEKIPISTRLKLKGKAQRYVSRGGLKLEKALNVFDVTAKGKCLLDIGSSTGGFTDAALQNGAKMSYALDVGTNQLAWKLRQDPRVVVMEQTNFRYCKLEDFTAGRPDLATIDVSFISLRLILPVLKNIIVPGGDVLALIKPQFEADRRDVGDKGVIRDPQVHRKVLASLFQFAAGIGFEIMAVDFSPIKGGEGNIEFLVHLRWRGENQGKLASGVKIEELLEKVAQTF